MPPGAQGGAQPGGQPPGGYRFPTAAAEAELREKGSRFLAVILPAAAEEEIPSLLAGLGRRFPDATHLCWAYRLGDPPRERAHDAGEPGGTAGAPILAALRRAGLADVLAAVARWFGGVKLGRGGLARAYAGVTRAALAGLPIERRERRIEIPVELPYERLGAVKRLLRPPRVELVAEEYGATVRLTLSCPATESAALRAALADLGLT